MRDNFGDFIPHRGIKFDYFSLNEGKYLEKNPSLRDFLFIFVPKKEKDMIDESLYNYMRELVKNVPSQFKRYMYSELPWDSRLVGIVGPCGVGKSTMLLQRVSETSENEHVLYVAADNFYFSTHTLLQLADDFVKDNGSHLFIDEIHKYKNWSNELKQIYDLHPKLKVTFTGSSVLDIQKGGADLSRRALMYEMQGLSFREFLNLRLGLDIKPYTLKQIVDNKVVINEIDHPLPLFREYLAKGYYPFSSEYGFDNRIYQIVAQTLDVDIPQYADMKIATSRKLKQLLAVVSKLVPFKPNNDSLSKEIGVSKNNIGDYFVYLEKAGMIGQLRGDTGGLRGLGKVDKIYIDNPSLMSVLASQKPDIGNVRETFFYNQLRVRNEVLSSKKSDFCIEKYTFEIGGRKKGKQQIEDVENGIIVRDEIEYGHGIVVPLWQFGLNY